MFKFGKSSIKRMTGVEKLLIDTAHEALELSKVDMTVPWMGGLRTDEEQNAIFKEGNSRANGYTKKSYHQTGMALDIIPFINGSGTYEADKEFLYFANIMISIFNYRKVIGEVNKNIYLHWGGFFGDKDLDGDGILKSGKDKLGWDMAHWEIRSSPQKRVLTING